MKAIFKLLSWLAGVLVTAYLLYQYVLFIIIVPSASMYPTIEVGDRIITTRIHNASSIKRGDILVFYSEELNETLVKRVIGLPGDEVEIDSDGIVTVNDQRLEEPYVKYPDHLDGTYRVPEGKYFFLGDARSHSYDSRKWDNPFVTENNIYGKAKLVVFPFNRVSVLK